MKGTKTQEDKDKKGRRVVHDSSETETVWCNRLNTIIRNISIFTITHLGTWEMFIDHLVSCGIKTIVMVVSFSCSEPFCSHCSFVVRCSSIRLYLTPRLTSWHSSFKLRHAHTHTHTHTHTCTHTHTRTWSTETLKPETHKLLHPDM